MLTALSIAALTAALLALALCAAGWYIIVQKVREWTRRDNEFAMSMVSQALETVRGCNAILAQNGQEQARKDSSLALALTSQAFGSLKDCNALLAAHVRSNATAPTAYENPGLPGLPLSTDDVRAEARRILTQTVKAPAPYTDVRSYEHGANFSPEETNGVTASRDA